MTLEQLISWNGTKLRSFISGRCEGGVSGGPCIGQPCFPGLFVSLQICNIKLHGIPGKLHQGWCLQTSGRCTLEWMLVLLPAEEGIAPSRLIMYLFKAHAGEIDSFLLLSPLPSPLCSCWQGCYSPGWMFSWMQRDFQEHGREDCTFMGWGF